MHITQLNTTPLSYEDAKESILSERKSLDSILFDWEGWDKLSEMSTVFYDCTLKIKLGEFKPGESFYSIILDLERSLIIASKEEWGYDFNEDKTQWKTKEVYFNIEL